MREFELLTDVLLGHETHTFKELKQDALIEVGLHLIKPRPDALWADRLTPVGRPAVGDSGDFGRGDKRLVLRSPREGRLLLCGLLRYQLCRACINQPALEQGKIEAVGSMIFPQYLSFHKLI